MERRLWKSVLTFVVTLVLTFGVIAMLSVATRAKAEPAALYSQQSKVSQSVTELSANVVEEKSSSAANVAAFGVILIIPSAALAGFLLSRRKGKKTEVSGKRYNPRADRTFAGAAVRTRV